MRADPNAHLIPVLARAARATAGAGEIADAMVTVESCWILTSARELQRWTAEKEARAADDADRASGRVIGGPSAAPPPVRDPEPATLQTRDGRTWMLAFASETQARAFSVANGLAAGGAVAPVAPVRWTAAMHAVLARSLDGALIDEGAPHRLMVERPACARIFARMTLPAFAALPSIAVVFAGPGPWLRASSGGITAFAFDQPAAAATVVPQIQELPPAARVEQVAGGALLAWLQRSGATHLLVNLALPDERFYDAAEIALGASLRASSASTTVASIVMPGESAQPAQPGPEPAPVLTAPSAPGRSAAQPAVATGWTAGPVGITGAVAARPTELQSLARVAGWALTEGDPSAASGLPASQSGAGTAAWGPIAQPAGGGPNSRASRPAGAEPVWGPAPSSAPAGSGGGPAPAVSSATPGVPAAATAFVSAPSALRGVPTPVPAVSSPEPETLALFGEWKRHAERGTLEPWRFVEGLSFQLPVYVAMERSADPAGWVPSLRRDSEGKWSAEIWVTEAAARDGLAMLGGGDRRVIHVAGIEALRLLLAQPADLATIGIERNRQGGGLTIPAPWALASILPLFLELPSLQRVPDVTPDRIAKLAGARGGRPEIVKSLIGNWRSLLGARVANDGPPVAVRFLERDWIAAFTNKMEIGRFKSRLPGTEALSEPFVARPPFGTWLEACARQGATGVALDPGGVPVLIEPADLLVLELWSRKTATQPSGQDLVRELATATTASPWPPALVGRIVADIPRWWCVTQASSGVVSIPGSRLTALFTSDALAQQFIRACRFMGQPLDGATATPIVSRWRRTAFDMVPPEAEGVWIDCEKAHTGGLVLDAAALQTVRARLVETLAPRIGLA